MLENYQFLSDQPLKEEKELQSANFGHRDVAAALVAIIKKCKSPFSIALSGKWGSGKSSIANLVQNTLKNEHDFSVVYFDIWKYEGDALRRSFLKEAVGQLENDKNFKNNFKLNERLYNSVTVKSEGNITLKRGSAIFKQFWKPFTVGVVGIVLISLLFKHWGLLSEYWRAWKIILASLGGVVGITTITSLLNIFFLKIIPQIITTETKTYGTDRFSDPHEFEKEFGNLLANLEKPKLLVIFDNLDRVTHDKGLEVLSTIKTFLEPKDAANCGKEVVFLIPCDIEAIKEHIRQVYAPKGGHLSASFNEDEFLRKFFNTILPIPDFILTELEDFAKKLLTETKVIEFNDDTVAWLVTKVFRENPRQIKQFINSLLSSYLLVQERCEQKTLAVTDITVAQLAKFLVIETKYSQSLEILKQKQEWNLENLAQDFFEDPRQPDFKQFLADTKHIPINNLQIFLTLRHSEQEQKFPGFDLFAVALKDGISPEAEKFIQTIPNFDEAKNSLTQAIKGVWHATSNKNSRFSIISTLLPILVSKTLKLDGQNVYDLFGNFLSEEKIEYLKAIEPSVVFNQILDNSKSYRKGLADKYLQILEKQGSGVESDKIKPDYGYAIVDQIAKHPDWFASQATRIQTVLTKFYPNHAQMILLFSDSGKVRSEFISAAFIQSFISSITSEETDGGEGSKFAQRIANLKLLNKELWETKTANALFQKITDLVTAESTKEVTPAQIEKEAFFLNETNQLLKHIPGDVFSKVKEKVDILATVSLQRANSIPEWNSKKIYIPILFTLRPYLTAELQTQTDALISGFIAEISIKKEALDYVNEKIGPDWLDIKASHAINLKDRSIADIDVFRWYYHKVTPEIQTTLLKNLVESSVDNFVKIVTELGENITDKKAVTDGILKKLPKVGTANKSSLFDICNKFECGKDEALQAKFGQYLIESLESNDKDLQAVAVKAFSEARHLSDDQKRKTIKDIITWLAKPETLAYQQECITIVLDGWGLISSQPAKMNEFIQFIFDKLLINSNDLESIQLGFKALSDIKPQFVQHESLYTDLRRKILDTTDQPIKDALRQGLSAAKPFLGIPDEHEFWDPLIGRKKEKIEELSADSEQVKK